MISDLKEAKTRFIPEGFEQIKTLGADCDISIKKVKPPGGGVSEGATREEKKMSANSLQRTFISFIGRSSK